MTKHRRAGSRWTGACAAVLLAVMPATRVLAADAAPTRTSLAAMRAQLQQTQAGIDAVNRLLAAIPRQLTDVNALAQSLLVTTLTEGFTP